MQKWQKKDFRAVASDGRRRSEVEVREKNEGMGKSRDKAGGDEGWGGSQRDEGGERGKEERAEHG